MKKIVNFIQENKYLFIILIAILIVFIGFAIKEKYDKSQINVLKNTYTTKEKYEANEFKIIRQEKTDVLKMYFNQYLDYILNDKEKAYNLLSDASKKKYSKEKYYRYLEKINYNSETTITNYYLENEEYYVIKDNLKNEYRIIEKGIWNYSIELI